MVQTAMKNAARMGTDRLGPLVASFSLPVIAGMIVSTLYNLIDRICVGRGVGAEALAGVTVSFPLSIVIYAVGMLFGLGGAAVVSLSLGRGDGAKAEKALGSALAMSLLVGAVTVGLGYLFMDPLLKAFGGSGAVLLYARDFTRVFLVGIFFQIVGMTLSSIVRAEGDPVTAFLTTIIGVAINVVLNPLFIFVLKLGVAGSALATSIGELVGCLWLLVYFLARRSALPLRRATLRPDPAVLREIVAIGIAPFCMQLALSVVMAISNNAVGLQGGSTGIAVMGIIYVIYPLILMPLTGLAAGVQPILGYNYGAALMERVRGTLKIAALLGSAFCLLACAGIMAGSTGIVRLFVKDDPAVVATGARALRIFFALLPVVGLQTIGAHFFQAIGRAGLSFLTNLLRQLIILVPLLVVLPRLLGLDGVWLCNPISDIAAAVITSLLLAAELARLRRSPAALPMNLPIGGR
jgi:putative MATE family efflux protein